MTDSKIFNKVNNSTNDNIKRSNPSHQNVRLKSVITTDNQQIDADCSDNDNLKTIFNSSSSASKTILITNKIQPKSNSITSGNSDNSSSITILTSPDGDDSGVINDNYDEDDDNDLLRKNRQTTQRSTVVLDRINICINNHYNEPLIQGSSAISPPKHTSKYENIMKKDEPDSTVSTPPSKDSEMFKHGQDVLVLQKDGCLYLGSVIAIARNQCLIKFGDNTERWASFHELTKLNSSEIDSLPICVVCKEKNSDDNVEVCEKCGRGYHEKCMDGGDVGSNGIWYCKRCTAQNPMRNRFTQNIEDDKKLCSIDSNSKQQFNIFYHKNQLPYNVHYKCEI